MNMTTAMDMQNKSATDAIIEVNGLHKVYGGSVTAL